MFTLQIQNQSEKIAESMSLSNFVSWRQFFAANFTFTDVTQYNASEAVLHLTGKRLRL